MAIRYNQPGAKVLLKFIPSFEQKDDHPTIFYIRQENVSTGMLRDRLFKIKLSGDTDSRSFKNAEVEGAGVEAHLEYFLSRIEKIENVADVSKDGELMTLESEQDIRAFLISDFPKADIMGRELETFLMKNSRLSEEEIKN